MSSTKSLEIRWKFFYPKTPIDPEFRAESEYVKIVSEKCEVKMEKNKNRKFLL
jgi:hypothetical protein